jgi:hypothetical protein
MTMAWLVRYGRPAFVGRFTSPTAFARGAEVVVDTPRGLEVGELLCPAPDGESDGPIVRAVSPDDQARRLEAEALAARLLAAAAERIESAGALVLDCEVVLDRSAALLHIVAWEPIDLTSQLDALATDFQLPVRIHDLSRTPVASDPTSCGKPDCGSGDCSSGGCDGCGTCSRGTVPPDELTRQFRELHDAMDRDALAGRRKLL